MRRISLVLASLLLTSGSAFGPAHGQEYQPPEDPEELAAVAAALADTPHGLAAGIAQVALGTEVPIEAKFEIEDGQLMLSVYTSELGLGVIAEENVFKEYKGDATQTTWTPNVEVFEDFQHIARSAQYHTLLSMTEVTILDIVDRASTEGTVFSVKPKVVDGAPVFEVIIAQDGAVGVRLYDLLTGDQRAAQVVPAQGGDVVAPADDGGAALNAWYTAEQAEQGVRDFAIACGGCHGTEMIETFAGYTTVEDYFLFITAAMPQDDPGNLGMRQYLSIVAYLLRENGFPAGEAELTNDREILGQIVPGAAGFE